MIPFCHLHFEGPVVPDDGNIPAMSFSISIEIGLKVSIQIINTLLLIYKMSVE